MGDAGGPGPGAARAEPAGAALSVDVVGLLAQLARSFALLLPVYALGYLGLSFSWVLLALALLAWCRRRRGLKATRLCRALALLEDEERTVRLGVRACDLPAWVSAAPEPRTCPTHFLPRPHSCPDPAPTPFLPRPGVRARDLPVGECGAGPAPTKSRPHADRSSRGCAVPRPDPPAAVRTARTAVTPPPALV